MKKQCWTWILALAVLVAPQVTWGAERIQLGAEQSGFSVSETEGLGEEINLEVEAVELDAVEIDGQLWAVVRVPGASNLMERGMPSLPFLKTEYLLGRTDGIELALDHVETMEIDLESRGFAGVAPSRGHFKRTVDPDTVSWEFSPRVYGSSTPFPEIDALVHRPYIAGPLRAHNIHVPVASWQPDTNRLTVVVSASFQVVHHPTAENPRTGLDRPMTGVFDQLARGLAVNYQQSSARYTSFVESGRLLILAHDDFLDEVAELAEWQEQVGYPTLLVPTSVSGTSANDVMSYIQGLYDEPEGLTWIILVGDYQQIPNFNGLMEGAPCDACYTKLEGNDNRPDASISRLSGQTGAEIATQVDKVLDYELLRDPGAGTVWYTEGFGIGSDDDGGTGMQDWERMDEFRSALIEPSFTFAGFDQIYHDPGSAAEVSDAINAGRSLGLYIGHGWENGWSTTDFDVSKVHQLTNGRMLPVIWSIACNNGQFHNVTECFGESWLRTEGGGAVSFEGGTTSESWLPPLDAMQAVLDSMRMKTAFTTGGQHVNGKLNCMDINGDENPSEGNMFMEQSTLFGTCTTWPRTLPPVVPDEPTDFDSTGGVATLTVAIAGQPVTSPNAVIVSFYADDGSSTTVVGSGHNDENGVVHAALSGDPTHCHIYGMNLVPTEFELAARPQGRVSLSSPRYSCSATVNVSVSDSNVPGSSPSTVDAVDVSLEGSSGSSIQVSLTEVNANRSIFRGAVVLGQDLVVSNGEILTVSYVDDNDGAGGAGLVRTDTAVVDCQGPTISSVQTVAGHDSADISFVTDEPGSSVVVYGTTRPPAFEVSAVAMVTDHDLKATGLTPCTLYYYEVRTTDDVGNLTVDNNGGDYYTFETAGWDYVFSADLSTDPGWQIENGSQSGDGWAWGTPTGGEQDSIGGPDPTEGFTGVSVYGVNLAGDYPTNLNQDELRLTTPVIDLSEVTSAQLRYQRWLGVEEDYYDHARIRLSIDGGATWSILWENGGNVDDGAWVEHIVSLDDAIGSDQVLVQWTMGVVDDYYQFCGWNIDDVVVEGAVPCNTTGDLFGDGFESGDTSVWSSSTP